MANTDFKILSSQVKPGTYTRLMLSAPESYSNATMQIPVHVINGKRAGPALFICAAIHGDEINGVEIIRRLLRQQVLKQLHGTLVAIPVVNTYGFIYQSRYLPDRRDLNRAFPGRRYGSLTSRLAYLFTREIVKKCNYGIDLHSGAIHRSNLPQIRVDLTAQDSKRLAMAFKAPVILNSDVLDGSLRQTGINLDIPILLYEAGEALRFDEISIRLGVQGILNVMHELGMLKIPKKKRRIIPRIAHYNIWIRANQSGILCPFVKLGQAVKKDDVLAVIADPFSKDEREVISPLAGIIIGYNNLPLVHEGEALFHIASFKEIDKVSKQLHKIQLEHEDLLDTF